jgi:hypothetical protein
MLRLSCILVAGALVIPVLAGPLVVLAQERGEEPPSIGEDRTVRDLRQDIAIDPGFGAADQARSRDIRALNLNAAQRDKRNEISNAGMARLLKDQTARQQTRNLRSFNPADRRSARRRARVDRRLRARINQ